MTLSMILGGLAAKSFDSTPNFLLRRVLFNTSYKCIDYNFVATS